MISKIIAALLLVLLMITITPKTFLHDILADHKDAPSCNDARLDGPCIHKQGYNCQQSDIVVPAAYLISEGQVVVIDPDFLVNEKFTYTTDLPKNAISFSCGRAPPVHV